MTRPPVPAASADPTHQVADPGPQPDGRRSDVDPTRGRPWLASDGTRYLVSLGVTAVVAAAYGAITPTLGAGDAGALGLVVTVYLGAWSVYSLLYAGLTWAVLRRADGDRLAQWLTEDRSARRRRRRIENFAGTAGPVGAVSFCAAAIGAVVAAAVLPQLRDDPVIVSLAVLVVAASWLLTVTVYAVHYARENAQHGGLEFRGADVEGPPSLTDYTYLAIQVGTAYNGADVTVVSRAMRRTVSVHAVVAFVFNSVLIALLVSLLITVTT